MDGETVAGWQKIKGLGNGSFGSLSLWKDSGTQALVAIKVCLRSANDLKEKQREYWIKEVDIMYKLCHENVVRAVPLPQELIDHLRCTLPPLGIEFCTGGDLRKVISKIDNQCGLPEKDLRNILHDICQALIYLHGLRIIHRDIKPENIVFQPNPSGRNVYKIIDLGYAKELEQTSLAQSFVGTLVYLAPELYDRRQYTYTVDYWSFGVLAFEMATGVRPFFHDLSPVEWIPMVKHKKDSVIYAFKTRQGNEYSTRLPDWCSLNEVFKEDFTSWLRTMLAFNPKNRVSEPQSSLEVMLAMLNRRVAHVYDSVHQKTLSFSENSNAQELYTKTMVPESSQLLLSGEAQITQFDRLLDLGTPRVADASISAFQYNFNGSYSLSPNSLPLRVKSILARSSGAMGYPEQRSLWQQMYLHVHSEFAICGTTLAAYRNLLLYLNNCHTDFSGKLNNLSSSYKEMKVLSQTLHEVMEYDKLQMRSVTHSALDELVSSENQEKTQKAVGSIKEKMREVVARANALHKKLVILRENPFGRSKPPQVLQTLHDAVYNLVLGLRQRNSNERKMAHPNTEMVTAVQEFSQEHQRVLKELSGHFAEALSHVKDVNVAVKHAEGLLTEVTKELSKLKLQHRGHYTSMWNVIKKLMIDDGGHSGAGRRDSLTRVPDVDMIVKENDAYRSQLDSLNSLMEQECTSMTSSMLQFSSFL